MSVVELDRPLRPDSLASVFQRVQDTVVPGLRAAVERLPQPLRDVVGYHIGWCDDAGRPAVMRPGKLLRPTLSLLSAQAVGGPAEWGVPCAVAVELVHNSGLLHDDVIDGALTRRDRPTVWWRFGMPTAILAGDALVPLAVEVLAVAPVSVTILCETLRELAYGQALDVSFELREDVTLDECLAMAARKTATLLGCACQLGAVHGGGTAAQIRELQRFGWHLGLAFQLVDDLLGIWGDPHTTGKPVLADLRAGKKTIPVVAALAGRDALARRLAELYLRAEPLDEHELSTVAELIERAGGRAWAHAEAARQVRTALAALDRAGIDPVVYPALVGLADLVQHRDR